MCHRIVFGSSDRIVLETGHKLFLCSSSLSNETNSQVKLIEVPTEVSARISFGLNYLLSSGLTTSQLSESVFESVIATRFLTM